MTSIRLRLLQRLIGPIVLINLAGGALAYALAWLPAQRAFDQDLLDAAGALGALLAGPARIDLPPQAERLLRADRADATYFVVRAADGAALAGDADFPPLRAAAQPYDGVMRGEPVRIAAVRVRAGAAEAVVGVARTLRQRRLIRAAGVRALVLLEALFALAAAGFIWFSVGNGLRPLARLRAELNARGGDALAPLELAHAPAELGPLLRAFNGLLDKAGAAERARHDFLAHVAHQLRTPLAGLRAQLDLLEPRHRREPETAHALALMRAASERMIRQTRQLLALARAEPGHGAARHREPVRLDLLVQEAVQHFVEQAGQKSIDLGFELAPATIGADRFLLRDLIDNLIDNAVRYTPPRGEVTVRCFERDGGAVLAIEDSGPGIAPEQRARVWQRFVRLDGQDGGSGLGLAIVRDIAGAHGAALAIDSGPHGRGLLVSVRFPPP